MGRLFSGLFEARRLLIIIRLRVLAFVKRAHLDLDIERGVRFEGRLLVRILAGSRSTMHIGSGTRIGDGVRLLLDGGRLDVGRRAQIRLGSVLHIRGDLILEDETIISYYCIVHCDERVYFGRRTGVAEHTTIVDSSHIAPPDGEWYYKHFETAPIHLGRDIWGGTKVTIGRGVTIGDGVVIAAGSVVTRDVPARSLVGGAPARVIGPSPIFPDQEAPPAPGQG